MKQLQVGSTIVITKCMLHYDETDLSGSSIIIIQEVRVTGLKKVTEQELKGSCPLKGRCTCTTMELLSGIFSGQGPVEFGEKAFGSSKLGKFDAV